MSLRRAWLWCSGVLFVASSIGAGVWLDQRFHTSRRGTADVEPAEAAMREHRPRDAVFEIESQRRRGKISRQLELLELEALWQTRDVWRLLTRYEEQPELFAEHESAALLVARGLMEDADASKFETLRSSWNGRETQIANWFVLDVDTLLHRGLKQEAKQLLESKEFEGADDCGRLTRLAILQGTTSLDEAWKMLDMAYQKDPRNSEVRLFRGQILEPLGKPRHAQVEYVAAHVAQPENPFFRDQLGEFYRRQGNYRLAAETWGEGLAQTHSSHHAVKAMFLDRVTLPAELPVHAIEGTSGQWKPLAEFLNQLPRNRFWDEETFPKKVERHQQLAERQEVYWLRLLEALRTHDEEQAVRALQSNRFYVESWNAELERALAAVLAYRKTGQLILNRNESVQQKMSAGELHSFLTLLETIERDAVPEELSAFLQSEHACSGVLLACGWLKAAVILDEGTTTSGKEPIWFQYGMTQAIRSVRGIEGALSYAERLPNSPEMDVLRGELLIGTGLRKEGEDLLRKHAERLGDFGYRAAWLLATGAEERRDVKSMQAIIAGQAELKESLVGKELLARGAMLAGEYDAAERIYGEIERDSLEAKAYFARKAFGSEDWNRARKLTEELIEEMPDSIVLHENLAAIAAAEQGGGENAAESR